MHSNASRRTFVKGLAAGGLLGGLGLWRAPVITANALRHSVLVELATALVIVALVAWLGTLSPDAG